MSAERATYLDSSAIVKLANEEPESGALRRYLRRREPFVVSAVARTEVARALLPLGATHVRRGYQVLSRIELVRVSDRILTAAGTMQPPELRSLDAIHLATAHHLADELSQLVTYDARLAAAAGVLGLRVVAPAG